MPILLQASNLSKEYRGRKIFSNLTFTISNRQKIGVIGRNGAGKSTLFKIIQNEETVDSGQVIVGREARIGYLKQGEDFNANETALEYLMRVGRKEDWAAKKMASKFQLGEKELSGLATSLSGGWRMRLRLAGMLISEPNLFLLDEPTNYLDLNTLLLLENYLRSYKGSFMIISHDREFIKKTCEETLEISNGGCYHYPGGLEAYLEFKEQKLSSLIKTNKSLERQQEHLQKFVDRFRAKASKAKQAQAVIRKIGKLEDKRISIEHQAGITRINIPPVVKRKNLVLRINNLSIGYQDQALVSGIDFDCRSGEKIAVLGLNGQGKTTFLRTLAGILPPIAGNFRWFSGSKIAYHGPETLDALNPEEQIGSYLRRVAAAEIKTEMVLKMAGDLLFRDDDLKKNIGVLSGGERSRLLLAGLLLSEPDVFILDEVTCHLDFETAEALGAALRKFNGTVVFSSHDRTFTNMLASCLVEISNGQGKMSALSYEDYIKALEKKLAIETETKKESEAKAPEAEQAYLIRKEGQKRMKALEKELEKLNGRQLDLLAYFSEHPTEYNPQRSQELEETKKTIIKKEDEWLNALEQCQ